MADPSAELASAVITRRNDAARPMFAVGELLRCLPEIDFSSGPLEGRLRALRDEMLYSACRPPKIAVYGATGKGKSTLLNAIAGADVLHFSNRGISCTRVPTELWSRRTSEETTYAVVEFDFFCGEEWLAQRQHLAELAGARNPDDDNQPYEASSSDPAKKELSRLYLPHAAHVFPAELQPADNANNLTAEQIDFLHRMPLASEPQIIRDLYTHNLENHVLYTAEDVKHKLQATCTVADARRRSSTAADSADLQGTALEFIERSSLIKLARVTGVNGFFPRLPEGACVVDTPGIGDVDAINVERAQAFQRNNATHTWICIEGARAGSDVGVQDLMYETAKLIADGKVGSMSVLLLKSDVWLYNETSDDPAAHDELMARLTERTDEVRESLSGSIQARVEQENVEFRTKVISAMRDAKMINVSARDYITLSQFPWGPMRTPQFKDLSETGVPKLVEIIQEQASLHEEALQDIKKEIAKCISEEIDEAERNACEVEQQLAREVADDLKVQLQELADGTDVTALTDLLVSINGMPDALQGRIDDLTQQCDASINQCAAQACSLHFKTLQAALRRHGGPIRSMSGGGTGWINLNAMIAFKLLAVLTTSWTAVFSPEFVSRAALRQVLADVQSAIDAVLAGANVADPAGNSGAERLDFRANLLARNASGCLAQLRTATGLSNLLEGSAKQALAGDLYDQVWAGTGVQQRMHAAVPEAYPLVYPVAWDALMRPVRQASTELIRMVREAVQHQVSIAINLIENSTVHPSGVPDEEARSNTYRSLASEMIRPTDPIWASAAAAEHEEDEGEEEEEEWW